MIILGSLKTLKRMKQLHFTGCSTEVSKYPISTVNFAPTPPQVLLAKLWLSWVTLFIWVILRLVLENDKQFICSNSSEYTYVPVNLE